MQEHHQRSMKFFYAKWGRYSYTFFDDEKEVYVVGEVNRPIEVKLKKK